MKAASVIPTVRRRDILQTVVAVAAVGAVPITRTAFAQGAAPKPKIGMIGSGNVGSSLGRVWAKAGYEVMFSSQDLAADKAIAAEIGAKSRAGTPLEAATFGEVLVFAVPYGALPELGKTLANAIKGKVVIDTSNPFAESRWRNRHRSTRAGSGHYHGKTAARRANRARLQCRERKKDG